MQTHAKMRELTDQIMKPALEKLAQAGLELAGVVTERNSEPGALAEIVGTMQDPRRAYTLLAEGIVSWRAARPRLALEWEHSASTADTIEAGDDEPFLEATIETRGPEHLVLCMSFGTVQIETECDTQEQAKLYAEGWREAIWYWNLIVARSLKQQPEPHEFTFVAGLLGLGTSRGQLSVLRLLLEQAGVRIDKAFLSLSEGRPPTRDDLTASIAKLEQWAHFGGGVGPIARVLEWMRRYADRLPPAEEPPP